MPPSRAGIMEVRTGWEEGFLAGLPLRAMPGIGPATARRLATLGLDDVWQVQQMAEAQLARLIGDEARPLKLRAHGWGGTVLRGDRLPRSVSRETTFSSDVRDPDELETMLLLFVTRVSAQLRDEQLMARTVTLKLRHDDFTTVTRSATLAEATDLDRELFEAVRPLFLDGFNTVRQRNHARAPDRRQRHEPYAGVGARPLRGAAAGTAPAVVAGGRPGTGEVRR